MTDEKIPFADYVLRQLESGKYTHVKGYFVDAPDCYVESTRWVHERDGWAGDPTERDSWNLFISVGWIFNSVVLHRGKLRTEIKLTKAQKQAFYAIEKKRKFNKADKDQLAKRARQKEIEELQWWP